MVRVRVLREEYTDSNKTAGSVRISRTKGGCSRCRCNGQGVRAGQSVGTGRSAGAPDPEHTHALLPQEFNAGGSIAYDIEAVGNIVGLAQRPDGSTVGILLKQAAHPAPHELRREPVDEV